MTNKLYTQRFKNNKLTTSGRTKVVIVLIGVMGLLFVVYSQAASFSIGLEPESGSISGNINLMNNDASASGGSAIQFATQTNSNDKKCAQLTNLKFCDDFDGNTGTYPDNSKWNVFTQGSSWGSHCWQKTPQNISMDGQGSLKMTIKDEGKTLCTDYYGDPSQLSSSGMDTGGGRFLTNQGRIEVRAKLSCATGVWGSIWTSGTPWPAQGEIDIWETMDGNLNRIKHTVHAGRDSSSAEKWHKGGYYSMNDRFCDNFHVYGAEWRQGYIQFMVDGVNTWRINESDTPSGKLWPFNYGQHRLLITLQYGNEAEGRGKPNPADLPTSMLIDYVRVYN